MSATGLPVPGRTRTCPHCKSTSLESASVCPACRHHLRFNPAAPVVTPAFSALRVEGVISNSQTTDHWEYAVVVAVRDERGAEIARQVVNVGALAPGERRACVVSVDVFKPPVARGAPPREA
jgi:hypothetical protein